MGLTQSEQHHANVNHSRLVSQKSVSRIEGSTRKHTCAMEQHYESVSDMTGKNMVNTFTNK